MLQASITVDLPSVETQRQKSFLQKVGAVLGVSYDLKDGMEELTIGSFSLVDGLTKAFVEAEIDNAIAFLVDNTVVYNDTEQVSNDIDELLRAAQSKGILDQTFQEMFLVLEHAEGGVHYIFDVRIKNRVSTGVEEMAVSVSGRLERLRIKPGETALAYATRLREFMMEPTEVEIYRSLFQGKVDHVAVSLQQHFRTSKITRTDARYQIIKPGVKQLANIRNLWFGEHVLAPTYRAVPDRHLRGAYADPFYYYYYDRYYDFLSLYMLDMMYQHPVWQSPFVDVVQPNGALIFTADQIMSDPEPLLADQVVGFDDAENPIVAETIPLYQGDLSMDEDWAGAGEGVPEQS